MLLKVDFLFVVLVVLIGSSLHEVQKSVEAGTLEVSQTQEHNKSLEVPDGSYPLVRDFKIQDPFVELFGIRSLPKATGVIRLSMTSAHGVCMWEMHLPPAPAPTRVVSTLMDVSAPLGV
jgi:hypothetical protein